ncbi:MAG: hypothetical protein ACK5KP_04255 [Paludibacteraceae bacterium]
MKRFLLLSTIALTCLSLFSAEKTSVVKDVFKAHAIQQVEYAQKLIRFTDAHAKQLVELEYQFLLDSQKAENCCICNSAKKIEKLKVDKYKKIEVILPKDEYIKYKAIDNKEIKRHPLWAE